jgi:signal peptidase II
VKSKGISLSLFFSSACVVFVVDALTKLAVANRLEQGGSVRVLGDFVRITHIRNIGASFGLFPGSTLTLIIVSSVAAFVVLIMALHSRGKVWTMITLGMIMGGALGNLSDRLRLGGVIDFIDIGIKSYRWPVFNAADVAVTLGVFLLLLHYLAHGEKPAESAEPDPQLGADVGVDVRLDGQSQED